MSFTKTYTGSPCTECGDKRKYSSIKRCKPCTDKAAPGDTYAGHKCKRCDRHKRYAKNAKCVFCTIEREKIARKRGVRKEPYATGGLPALPKFEYRPMATPDFSKDNLRGYLSYVRVIS